MSLCDLITGISRLTRATKQLREAWLETKEVWDDGVSREFEEKYLNALLPHLRLTTTAIHEMDELMRDAERACADNGR